MIMLTKLMSIWNQFDPSVHHVTDRKQGNTPLVPSSLLENQWHQPLTYTQPLTRVSRNTGLTSCRSLSSPCRYPGGIIATEEKWLKGEQREERGRKS